MELIKLARRRSAWGELIYIILNLAYAGVLFGLVMAFDPPWLAYLTVVLSKWRVFAVRPRFWFANLQANVVDTVVGASFVTLLWLSMGSLVMQIILLLLFVGWLLMVKPRSSRQMVLLQAAIGQFTGLMALFALSYEVPASVVVVISWIIGYTMARHALSAYSDETERTLLSLIWGFVIAEMAWLAQHWTIAYVIGGGVMVPQVAVIAGLLGFLTIKVYGAIRAETKHIWRELRWPIIFVTILTLALLLRFNGFDMTQL